MLTAHCHSLEAPFLVINDVKLVPLLSSVIPAKRRRYWAHWQLSWSFSKPLSSAEKRMVVGWEQDDGDAGPHLQASSQSLKHTHTHGSDHSWISALDTTAGHNWSCFFLAVLYGWRGYQLARLGCGTVRVPGLCLCWANNELGLLVEG